ncbi:MAG: tRNA preQ1(34) S-adenosylmethionine ribosyltransferase-isomerase QueA [Candidatus Gracilibacteria bacterium]
MYDYHLPQELIAKEPASPRDLSKLFIYDTATDKITFDRFENLDKYLPQNSFLVMNKTKVIPARLKVRKETGGTVELLLLINELQPGDTLIKGLSDRKILPGQKLHISEKHLLEVEKQDEKIFYFKPNFPLEDLTAVLLEYGITPIPKYIKETPLTESDLREKYQTVFAKNPGSVAAPTASLHFTPRVFKKLEAKQIPHLFVNLHVGLGTFAPITEENLRSKKLFEEFYEIEKSTEDEIKELKQQGKKLVAAGTTTVRTLESAAKFKKSSGATDIFIFPPFEFRAVDALITNFHIPNSSLMMLVEAFLQFKHSKKHLHELYEIAIKENFRFYSFGDAMLIL